METYARLIGIKLWLFLLGLSFLAFCASGCGTTLSNQNVENWQNKFYEQQRHFTVLTLRASEGIMFEGETEIMVEAPLEKLSVIPSNPSIMNSLERIAKAGFLAYGAVELGKSISDASETQIVEQPAPTIVTPEVVNPVVLP